VRTTADDGWLLFNQTVLNAQSIYPALWDVVPVGWRSGSSLVLPNMADRMVEGVGVTAVGATGGANAKTIAANNLPTHTHPVTVTDAGHNHTQNPHHHTTNIIAKAFTTALDGLSGGTSNNNSQNYQSDDVTATNIATTTGITAAATANTTTATALDVTPAHMALVYQIRAF
jgi:microcystin-dependent protein